jgi:hypothetical protein
MLAGTLLLAPAALADDHHFQAITSGALTFDIELGAAVNKAGHVLPDSPGQASPFTETINAPLRPIPKPRITSRT